VAGYDASGYSILINGVAKSVIGVFGVLNGLYRRSGGINNHVYLSIYSAAINGAVMKIQKAGDNAMAAAKPHQRG